METQSCNGCLCSHTLEWGHGWHDICATCMLLQSGIDHDHVRTACLSLATIEAMGVRLITVNTMKSVRACVQVEKEVVKAIRQMEEVEVEVKKKKEVSSRVKQLRRQVGLTPPGVA